MARALEDCIRILSDKLRRKEAFVQRLSDQLAPLRERIQRLENRLAEQANLTTPKT